MKSRRADTTLRVALLLVGISSFVVVLVLSEETRGWEPLWRVMVLLVPGGLAYVGLMGGGQLRDRHLERTHYGARRAGDDPSLAWLKAESWGFEARGASPGANHLPVTSFGIRRRNSLVALGVTSAVAAGAFIFGYDAASRPEPLSATGAIALVALAPALYFVVRSVGRSLLAGSAIRSKGNAVTFGQALGFVPPVRIGRSELLALVDARTVNGQLVFVAESTRMYGFQAEHLADPDVIVEWFTISWPEVPIARLDERANQAPSFEDLAPSIVAPGSVGTGTSNQTYSAPSVQFEDQGADSSSRPPQHRLTAMRRVLRRRVLAAGAVFLFTVAGLAPALWWYLDQRAANDQLVAEGTPVVATVVKVDRSSRGPDSLEVAFLHDDELIERTIYSGFFTGFSRDVKGRQITVLFDPRDPELIRLPDQRNIFLWTWIALLTTGLLSLLGSLSLAHALHAMAAVDGASWIRRRIHAVPRARRHRAYLIVDEPGAIGPIHLSNPSGLRKTKLENAEAWVGVGRRVTIVLPVQDDELTITVQGRRPNTRSL